MLVGATGAGKTTLINGMANYIMGVQWDDDLRFKLIAEPNSHDQTVSQTSCMYHCLHLLQRNRFSSFIHTNSDLYSWVW